MDYFIQIKNLVKKFRDNDALKDVNINIKKGEIHGLVGANGSGKSTLLNILFGNSVIKETGGYGGKIIIDGKHEKITHTQDAVKAGIGMIHQEFALIGDMNVAENININKENVYNITQKFFGKKFAYIDKKENHKQAKEVLNKLGIDLDTNIKVINLSSNMKQFVEIAREIHKSNLKLLLLDEPTAVLNKRDSKKLIETLKEISDRGTTIIFISHRLEEIVDLCNRVTVLRDGQVISTYEKEEFDIEKMAEDMIGHKVVKASKEYSASSENNIMEFKNFSVHMKGETIRNIDLDIKEGEILGITGLSGHGKLALPYGVMGMYQVDGKVIYDGKEVNTDSLDMIKNGVYVIPDDRRSLGLLLDHSVEENITFNAIHNKGMFLNKFPISALGTVKNKETSDYANLCVEKYEIKCSSINQKVRELSGGNQQKVCIARALAIKPRVIFISEPTRGIDINAKEKILDIIVNINKEDKATVIICSSELGELKRVCDRIAVMYEGKIADILSPKCDDKTFALAFSGERSINYE